LARILVVDDESSVRFLLRVAFELDAHQVEEAPNGLAAIQSVEGGRPPDLIATDFMTPLMNGGELIARLRANPTTSEIPVILVSASPGSERRTEADQSDHSKGLIGFTIGQDGITFGDKIDHVSGMLGWSALSGGEPEPIP